MADIFCTFFHFRVRECAVRAVWSQGQIRWGVVRKVSTWLLPTVFDFTSAIFLQRDWDVVATPVAFMVKSSRLRFEPWLGLLCSTGQKYSPLQFRWWSGTYAEQHCSWCNTQELIKLVVIVWIWKKTNKQCL